ncbi:MAG TPA: cytochrome c [Vicinamibacterales bacterium]|jgi:mono/diheme cytochrome c family protein|nr:cytochrome c [Vicinamibacterales bacterium]
MKICRFRISRFAGLASILSLFLMTVVYAGQAKPPASAKSAAAAAKATPESIASGETIFKRQCQMCHGATGMGDGPAAKTLKGKLPNLADKATLAKVTDDDIHELVENGKKSEIGNMPAFKSKLKAEEIQDVINYVHTLAK